MIPLFEITSIQGNSDQSWFDYIQTHFNEKSMPGSNMEKAFLHNFNPQIQFTDTDALSWVTLLRNNKLRGNLTNFTIGEIYRQLYECSSKSSNIDESFGFALQTININSRLDFLTHNYNSDPIHLISYAKNYAEHMLLMCSEINIMRSPEKFKYLAQHVLSASLTGQFQTLIEGGLDQKSQYLLCSNYIKMASGVFDYESNNPGSVVFESKERELEWLYSSCLCFDYMIDTKLMTDFVISKTHAKLDTRFKELSPELYQNYQKSKTLINTGLVSNVHTLYNLSTLEKESNAVELPQLG